VYLYIPVTHEVKAAFTSNKKHAARKQQAAVSLLLIHLLQMTSSRNGKAASAHGTPANQHLCNTAVHCKDTIPKI
jgi:hypothetical protein